MSSNETTRAKLNFATFRAAASLRNMVSEMLKKQLDLKRITKTASMLITSGVTANSLSDEIALRCVSQQGDDGGWISIPDTMWNSFFLKCYDRHRFSESLERAIAYLDVNAGNTGLWGRSRRDMERIPISGMLLYLHPELVNDNRMCSLERLWESEKNSLTYKAAYTLQAFRSTGYMPTNTLLIAETLNWLASNQRDDGSFAPWRDHPVASDVYCTALSVLGLTSYPDITHAETIRKAVDWITRTQLPSGIWPFHEIEDGASWALAALNKARYLYAGE